MHDKGYTYMYVIPAVFGGLPLHGPRQYPTRRDAEMIKLTNPGRTGPRVSLSPLTPWPQIFPQLQMLL